MEQPAMGTRTTAMPADRLELYESLVTTQLRVERKGANMPFTSLTGHKFSILTETGTLALRLPTAEREAFLKKYNSKLREQHGSVLKEYVEVPDGLLERTRELQKYFDPSYAYVATLKPKPTSRKKKGTK